MASVVGSNPILTTDTHGNLELVHHEQVMRANMENTSQCVGKHQVLLTVGKDPLYSQVVDMYTGSCSVRQKGMLLYTSPHYRFESYSGAN